MMAVFVFTSALAALFTVATALSVADFLQLIFPSGEGNIGFSIGNANPIEALLSKIYVFLVGQGTMLALIYYALLLFVLYGLKNVCSYFSTVSFARVKTEVLYDIRNGLHAAVLHQPFAGWSQQHQGQWLSRMSNDITEYENNMLESIRMIISSVLTMVIYIFMLFYLDWRMTLMVVAVMLVGTLLLSASRKLKRQSKKLQNLNGDLMTTTQETIDSLKEIKAATAIDYVNDRQRAQNRTFTRQRTSIYRRIDAASPLSDFVGNTIVVVILILGAHRILGDAASLSPALFISYIMIYVLLLAPIKDFSNAIAQLKKGRGVEERLMEALDGNPATERRPLVCEKVNNPTSIELRDVSFSYDGCPVFSHLDFSVPMHQHTAIVGESGSGKTTLGRLLVGLMDPQQGEILINGKPTTAADRAGCIAYISQDPMLFNDTLEANIRFGRDNFTSDDIAQAMHVAQVDSIVQNLHDGIKTNIGDGGSRLSGGERQRVNIARALVGNPGIVVMDEATAALDASTEQQFTDLLRDTMHDRTMIIIAHRAATIAHCDRVYSIEEKRFIR